MSTTLIKLVPRCQRSLHYTFPLPALFSVTKLKNKKFQELTFWKPLVLYNLAPESPILSLWIRPDWDWTWRLRVRIRSWLYELHKSSWIVVTGGRWTGRGTTPTAFWTRSPSFFRIRFFFSRRGRCGRSATFFHARWRIVFFGNGRTVKLKLIFFR